MSISVKLNLSRLHRVLQGTPQAIDRGAKAYSLAVKDLAVQLAPYGDSDDPAHEHLRDTAEVVPGDRQGTYQVVFHSDHAIFVEYGTVFMDAQPFLTPAQRRVAPLPFFARELAPLIRS